MPLVDFLFRCPLCHHDPLEGKGDRAWCPSCRRIFRRGGEGGMMRIQAPSGSSVERPGQELGASLAPIDLPSSPLPQSPQDCLLRARVHFRLASFETPVRFRGEVVGFREVLGPKALGFLELSPDALTLWPETEGTTPLHEWGLLDIRAVQTSSRSLQISPPTGGVVQFRFLDDSIKRWEDLLHQCLRDRYRKEGLGEVLEFQPRIVTENGENVGLASPEDPWVTSETGEVEKRAEERPKESKESRGAAFFSGFGWYGIVRALFKAVVALGSRMEVRGLENIPAEGPFVLVANHQSLLDPLFVQVACRRHLHTLTKSTQFGVPFFGWMLPRVKAIPTRRYRVDPQAVRMVLRRLSQGEAVGIYPEGERSWDGYLQPFRRGTLRLLLGAGVPIVPCGISGAYDAWPRWSRLIRKRKVRINFGRPMVWPRLGTRAEREVMLPWADATLVGALKELGAWVRS